MKIGRPSKADLAAAVRRQLPDLIGPGLQVLFCGINPGLYSAALGHHFARPGNRFWPALHAGGFTSRTLSPAEDRLLIDSGFGLTNLVDRATVAADELSTTELIAGLESLTEKVRRYAPDWIAILGIGA
jgi:TDG/mug DNA glycosylase family protein